MPVDTTKPVRMLIINPNTSQPMTEGLKPVIDSLGYQAQYTYFTCPPPGIPSINSPSDAAESAAYCLPHLRPLVRDHDAFLVACYSEHPLVGDLTREFDSAGYDGKHVIGIFEASVKTSVRLLSETPHDASETQKHESFGIVSTGKVWEAALEGAVKRMLGAKATRCFAGCETTGLNASELHDLPAEEVRKKMMEATQRVIRRGIAGGTEVRAVCLGCAGMVGLDAAVREACVLELGETAGRAVHIVDGVKAGVQALMAAADAGDSQSNLGLLQGALT